MLLVSAGGDVSVRVNGVAAKERTAYRASELFVEHIPNGPHERPTPEGCRLLDIPEIQAGANTITIRNETPDTLTIDRANLGLW